MPSTGPRFAGVDALRGGALCLMFVYHFAFDLRFYRVIAADFEHDPFWLGFRALIVASFMALVGVSLVFPYPARPAAPLSPSLRLQALGRPGRIQFRCC